MPTLVFPCAVVAKYTWVTRVSLKYELGNGNARCAMCGDLLLAQNWDLHEALFTRGDLAGVKWQEKIFHPYNCVGVCHHGCHIRATSMGGQIDAALWLIERYGYEEVFGWVMALPFKSEVTRRVALSILQEAKNG